MGKKTQVESSADGLKAAMMTRKKPTVVPTSDLLSTGATLLDLGCSGRTAGGIAKGNYVLFPGKSNSGKTFISLNVLAEAANNKNFKNYRIIVNNPENGMLMDIAHFYGNNLLSRMEVPHTKGGKRSSRTIEEHYDALHDAFDKKIPFIYLLDSENALPAADDIKKQRKQRNARESNEESSGSYGTAKAKIHSNRLPEVVSRLTESGSILMVISQARQNIGFGAQFNPDTRSGGTALSFYAHLELWSSIRQKLTKNVLGKTREIGTLSLVKVKRSRISGSPREALIPIYNKTGIDDVGSCVAFLVEEGRWKTAKGGDETVPADSKKKSKGLIQATDFDVSLKEEALIRHIEENNLESELKIIVGEVWDEIEEACTLPRKRRYE